MSRNKTPTPPRRCRWFSVNHGCAHGLDGPRRKTDPRGDGVAAINPKPRRCKARRLCQTHWSLHSISEATFQVVVFHLRLRFHLYYTSDVAAQSQTGVKLNRVFFPRLALQVRSLDCRFAR
eukprot:gene1771-gene1440